MGVSSRDTVRKAAKLAVYDAMMMNLETKNLGMLRPFLSMVNRKGRVRR